MVWLLDSRYVLYNLDMATIHRFEDLNTWQSVRELTNLIYELTQSGEFARDYGLRVQMRRAASSVMLNIAEKFDAGSDSEFIRFLGYARQSISETQAGLYTALDKNIFNNPNLIQFSIKRPFA